MNRSKIIEQLKSSFDVFIIGGGITGAGAARDAAHRGLKTAVVDMNDFAYGTSSRSSKLVHGGLRYLENAEFSLVFESVSERRILMNIAPHLVNPCGFIFPVYKSSRRGVFAINVGMWLYDGLSLFRSPKMHRSLSKKDIVKEEPMLNRNEFRGASLYYDCATDDARLTLETLLDAEAHGAVVANYVRVIGFVRDAQQNISGVKLKDEITGEEWETMTSTVINATGPWSDRTRDIEGRGDGKQRLRPTKGVHIVVDTSKLKLNNAIVCFHPEDGRVLFAIPWGDRSYIGTTDTDYSGDPKDVYASTEDVSYLLDAANFYFPLAKLEMSDVIATWAGLRPLVSDEASEDESKISREHEVRVDKDLLITIAGGKLTTYRKMGAEVVDKAIEVMRTIGRLNKKPQTANTASEPLLGAIGWSEDDDHQAIAQTVLEFSNDLISRDTAELLTNTYGMRALDIAQMVVTDQALAQLLTPGRHEILAQVDFGVKKELATTICDFLVRRTQIYFRDFSQGLDCCELVANRMQQLLGWTPERKQKELEDYRLEVSRGRAWQVD